MEKQNKKITPGLILVRIGIAATLVLIILLVLNYYKIISFDEIFKLGNKISQFNSQLNDNNPSKIIAKVGAENIYQKDLDDEKRNYPPLKNVDSKKLLLDKMVKDSIILQGAQEDDIVKLDGSVYNNFQKNYSQRISLISDVKNKIEMKSSVLTGAIVSLWFYNRTPGRMGYEKSRELARTTIQKLHDEVVNKKLTIQQAGQAIRNDPKLGYVDNAYLSNALLEFSKSPSEPVVFDSGFDTIIKQLKIDEVSDVYLAKSKQRDQADTMIDAVYMFAQITGKKKTNITGFDDWYIQKSKSYAVTYY